MAMLNKNICETLLIVSGDVEMSPGPSKACPKFEKPVPNKMMVFALWIYF